ncbi:MAG: eL32 family ribosomal protein [archaeon]
MVNEVKRKKPKFLRKDWHKKIKLGSTVKKKRKWRAAKGRHNKIRLNRKGHSRRPKIGWGSKIGTSGLVGDVRIVRVLNLKDLEGLKKGFTILIGKVGLKKRKEILAKADENGLIVMNKYKNIVGKKAEVEKVVKTEKKEEKKIETKKIKSEKKK